MTVPLPLLVPLLLTQNLCPMLTARERLLLEVHNLQASIPPNDCGVFGPWKIGLLEAPSKPWKCSKCGSEYDRRIIEKTIIDVVHRMELSTQI